VSDVTTTTITAVDTIGTKFVSVDIHTVEVQYFGGQRAEVSRGRCGPTIPVALWKRYTKASRALKSASRKFVEADSKRTDAEKTTRYIIVNHLWDEAVGGFKYATWEKRLRKWYPISEQRYAELSAARVEFEAAESEILNFNDTLLTER
jgi:hypothetical protein